MVLNVLASLELCFGAENGTGISPFIFGGYIVQYVNKSKVPCAVRYRTVRYGTVMFGTVRYRTCRNRNIVYTLQK